MEDINVELVLYAVINSDGKWFRAKGMNGYGDNWVDNIQNAKIYPRIGPARSVVTFYGKHNLKEIPKIVKIISTKIEILDEVDRVKKSIKVKHEKEAKRKIAINQIKVADAEKKLKAAEEELKQLRKDEGINN